MATRQFGDALTTKVLQPGAVFRKTRAGFDTGTRTYKVDQAYAASQSPAIDAAAGSPYSNMFVSEVETTNTENGEALLTVQYLGLITGTSKASDYEVSYIKETRTVMVQSTPSGGIGGTTIVGEVKTSVLRPSVVETYVSAVAPTASVGFSSGPGVVTGGITIGVDGFSIVSGWIKQQGWAIVDVGYRKSGPLYEVKIEHEYLYTTDFTESLAP